MVGTKVKMNANGAHTFLEVKAFTPNSILLFLQTVKVRFGTGPHFSSHLIHFFALWWCAAPSCSAGTRRVAG
ncbi:hypothetical protein BDZ97DRAFT_601117 [Flammula alnicola]|nr:hypothetical protein BDZ97DRAFT_601117 [Flammula alnicola]